jgi:septum site-determining protein MinC
MNQVQTKRIAIKGTGEGLIITFLEGDWNDLLNELDSRLAGTAAFFKGGRVALKIGSRQLTTQEIQDIGNLLLDHGITLWAVESTADDTLRAAGELGLEVSGNQATPVEEKNEAEAGAGLVVRQTLRSGQIIRHEGSVVIIGDVNPGAEVIAGKDVVVWGRLRGTVHAGANGDDKALVCALSFSPLQLRIGSYIARPPDDESGRKIEPEMAYVFDDQIVVEPWQ